MKKATFTFVLGALAAAVPALLALQHYRQKDLERLIDQRQRLQKQIETQRRLLTEAIEALQAQSTVKR